MTRPRAVSRSLRKAPRKVSVRQWPCWRERGLNSVSVVERIEIGRESVSIIGTKANIDRSVKADELPLEPVRGFIPKWCTRQDFEPVVFGIAMAVR